MPSITADRERREKIHRLAALYSSRWQQGYVRGKLRHDPVFDDAVKWLQQRPPTGTLLDAGCGLGLLPQWLRAHGIEVPVRGVDPDGEKIESARVAAQRGGLQDVDFQTADVRELVPAEYGGIFLLDMLHYLPLSDRDALLGRMAVQLPAGGFVYIRNGLRQNGWRYELTRLEEWFIRLTGWIRGPRFPLPAASEITRHFPEAQFERTVGPLWGRTPFSSFRLGFVKR